MTTKTTIKLHRFTENGNLLYSEKINNAGILSTRADLERQKRYVSKDISKLLWDTDLVELVDEDIEFDMSLNFNSQKAFTEYLIGQFGGIDIASQYLNDKFVMNWLALVYLDVITVNTKNENIFILGEGTRYIIETGYHKRHLIRTPLWIRCHVPEGFDFVLQYTSPTQISDIVDQYLNNGIIRCLPAALQLGNDVFYYLYERDGNQKAVREYENRLSHVISQYYENYNLVDLNKKNLARFLMREPTLRNILSETYPELVYEMDLENEPV